ncbi:MAG: glycosyltransferase family 2 protein, partial [Okeania sp. SIO3B3]|nr:glycosyltransferase family 2 protein [Okeania sp. SIO3B3]
MFFSVVIPTYNRKPILEKCLRALENQDYDRPIIDYEVIVVDDGSTDDTIPWLETEAKEFPHVQLFSQ